MFLPLIEFCVNNLASGAQKARQTLEKDPNVDVIDYGCLGYCGKCANRFFALVNGEYIEGDTVEQLVENIYKYLDENKGF